MFLVLMLIPTNLLLSQLIEKGNMNISMSIYWMGDNNKIEKKEDIKPSLIKHYISCLHETDRPDWNVNEFYGKDEINIIFYVSELRVEGMLFTVTTNNLIFSTMGSWFKEYYEDTKGLLLLRTFLIHLSQEVWSYPSKMTTLDASDIYYVNYKLPNKKELYFTYHNYDKEKFLFSLQKAEYYKFNEVSAKTKMKKGKTLKGKFVETDFVPLYIRDSRTDYYKYPSSFYDYMGEYAKFKNE